MRSVILTYIFTLLLVIPAASAQQVTPFLGQGIPPETPTNVYVTVGLDRLLSVDDENYRFEVILFMLLTWVDDRAYPAMVASTEKVLAGNGTCTTTCSTAMFVDDQFQKCCDGVWLPALQFVNARGFSQDRMVRSSIQFPQQRGNFSRNAVSWWAHVQGEFYTNYDFAAFPFDKQRLIVQLAYSDRTPDRPVVFQGSGSTLSMYFPRGGDDISGWNIESLTMNFYNVSLDTVYNKASLAAPGDPFPLHPANPDDLRFISSLWLQGFVITINIERISVYFILTAIIPIVLNVWLALLVFSVSPKHLDTRLGIIVTLFLSLTALMLVVSAGLPQSSTVVPTQQLSLLSYFVLGFIGLDSILMYKVVTVERTNNIKKRTLRAKTAFLQRIDALQRSQTMARNKAGGTTADPSGVVTNKNSGKAYFPWLKRRKRSSSAINQRPAEVAVTLPDELASGGSSQQQQQPEIGAPSNANNIPPMNDASRKKSADRTGTMEYGFGGVHATGNDDSDDSAPFGGESDGSSYASSEGRRDHQDSQDAAENAEKWYDPRHFIGRHVSVWRESFRETRRNPDYALHFALTVDKWVFWITLLGYNIAAILILALNANKQPASQFVS